MISKVHDDPPPPSPVRPAVLASYALALAAGISAGFVIGHRKAQTEPTAVVYVPAKVAPVAAAPAPPATAPVAAAASTTAATGDDIGKLLLVGTSVAANSHKSKAWIQEDGATYARQYVTGDFLPGNYQVMTIAADRVIAFREGQRYTLQVSSNALLGEPAPPADPHAVTAHRPAGERSYDDGRTATAASSNSLPEMEGPANRH